MHSNLHIELSKIVKIYLVCPYSAKAHTSAITYSAGTYAKAACIQDLLYLTYVIPSRDMPAEL